MKTLKSIGKVFAGIYLAVAILVAVWGFASWIDIVADNNMPNPVHSEYNLFVLLFDREV